MKKKEIKNNLKDFETIDLMNKQVREYKYIYDRTNNRFLPIIPENTLLLVSVNAYGPVSAMLFDNPDYPTPICKIEFTRTNIDDDVIDALIEAGFKKDNIIIEDDIILI